MRALIFLNLMIACWGYLYGPTMKGLGILSTAASLMGPYLGNDIDRAATVEHALVDNSRVVANSGLNERNIHADAHIIPRVVSSLVDRSTFVTAMETKEGIAQVDGEALRLFTKARQCESDGLFKDAQELYEQVVQAEPDFIFGWANLGNVLVSQGNLEQALLCYRKALSLRPTGEQLSLILLNTASTELSLGLSDLAVRDIDYAEIVSGPTPVILTNKAVALTQKGQWNEGVKLFEKVFKTSEKDALPWWLRYSMALLETDRGTESVAYLQRTLQRFPYETECKAFATALYTSLGSKPEASRYWKQMTSSEQSQYTNVDFLRDKLKWGPVAVKALEDFTSSKNAN